MGIEQGQENITEDTSSPATMICRKMRRHYDTQNSLHSKCTCFIWCLSNGIDLTVCNVHITATAGHNSHYIRC